MGKVKKSLSSIFIIFLCLYANAQITIQGKISDIKGLPISGASIILKDVAGNTLSYTRTNDQGAYTIKTQTSDKYLLSINAIEFEKQTFEISKSAPNQLQEYNFVLNPKTVEIEEVEIKRTSPIVIEKDKIIFDAKSFSQGNEQVIEDLLKKIPGLNVSDDGTIKVGNQEVEKVMIEGDDFFEKGYRILTKNMPVNPIDKVELLQRYSNNKLLKDVENSQKVALNLTLKEDYKREWFGNLEAGSSIAPESRYDVRSNVMNFGKKNKYYFLTSLNNIGVESAGNTDYIIASTNQEEASGIGNNQKVNPFLNLDFSMPNLKQDRINFNNNELVSLNSIFKISEKAKLKILGLLNTDENDYFRNSTQTYLLGEESFINSENFQGRKKNITAIGKLDFFYDISENKSLEFISRYKYSDERKKSSLLFNNIPIAEQLSNQNSFFDQKLVYTHKFQNKNVFLLTGRFITETLPEDYSVNQFLFNDLFPNLSANNTNQISNRKMQFAGIEGHLLSRKENGNLLEFKFGKQYRSDNLVTDYLIKNNEHVIVQPSEYQNNRQTSANDLYAVGKYQFNFGKINLVTQAQGHQISAVSETVSSTNIYSNFFINPKFSLEWRFNDKNKFLGSYSYNKALVEPKDIYGQYIQNGYRSFSKGLDDFNQLASSIASVNYEFGSWGDKFFANASIQYSNNHDYLSTRTFIKENFSQSESIIIKDRNTVMLNTDVNRYFKPLKSNLKLTMGLSQSNFENEINNLGLRSVETTSLNYGAEMRSSFKGFFNYHLGSRWNTSTVKTGISNSFTNNYSFIDLFFILNKKVNFELKTERYFFGNLDKGSNQYYFSDFRFRYHIVENKLTLSAVGNNLFNTKSYKDFMISDVSISKTEYKLLPRYLLLKLEYRF